MTTLLIDGDLLLYRASAASECEMQWDDDVWLLHGNLTEAKELFRNALEGITTTLAHESYTLYLSDRENFRKTLAPTYKSARKSTRKPVVFRPLLEWIKDTYAPVILPSLEADDAIGIAATTPGAKAVIVSDDKDMQTLACTLYRMGELSSVSSEEADRYWMMQTLTGDATDGYSGCPGIGPKTAEKLLTGKSLKDNWNHVVNAYRKVGLTEDDAVLNARLARILRHGDWDNEKQEVKLWNPSMIT